MSFEIAYLCDIHVFDDIQSMIQ